MKKLIATTLVMLSCGISYALPVGNPAEASLLTWGVFIPPPQPCPCDPCFRCFDMWSLRVGYYGDYVFDRNLAIDGEGFGQGEVIDETCIYTNAGYLVLNVANKLDVFGTLGSSKISITTNEVSWEALANSVSHFDWKSAFSWSVGARATLLACKGFFVGVEGQYFQTQPQLNRFINVFSTPQYQYFNDTSHMKYREWQVGLGASYALCCFCSKISLVPYAAGTWSRCQFKTNDFTFIQLSNETEVTLFDLKSHKRWGYAIGLSATFCDMVCLTIEGRGGDERALYFNANFRI